jgi:hypothetical protein
LDAARDATLEGDEERDGALMFGGGGNVVLGLISVNGVWAVDVRLVLDSLRGADDNSKRKIKDIGQSDGI